MRIRGSSASRSPSPTKLAVHLDGLVSHVPDELEGAEAHRRRGELRTLGQVRRFDTAQEVLGDNAKWGGAWHGLNHEDATRRLHVKANRVIVENGDAPCSNTTGSPFNAAPQPG